MLDAKLQVLSFCLPLNAIPCRGLEQASMLEIFIASSRILGF
jgi:hypothetical protein